MGWIRTLYVILLATSLALRIATVIENYREQKKYGKMLPYDKKDSEENNHE